VKSPAYHDHFASAHFAETSGRYRECRSHHSAGAISAQPSLPRRLGAGVSSTGRPTSPPAATAAGWDFCLVSQHGRRCFADEPFLRTSGRASKPQRLVPDLLGNKNACLQ
jgi:hypothetical protein